MSQIRKNRVPIRLRVFIMCQGQSYRCFTEDISDEQISLASNAPEHFKGQVLDVWIGSPNLRRNLKLVASLRPDRSNSLYFLNPDSETIARLHRWVHRYLAYISESRRAS